MTKRTRLATIGATFLLSAGLVAACGDDDDGGSDGDDGGEDAVEASTYVGDVCGAINEFTTSVQGAQATVESMTSADTPAEGQQVIVDFFGDAATAGEELSTSIEDAGVPDVENGEGIASTLEGAFSTFSTALSDAESDAESLPTDDPAIFESSAQTLIADFQSSLATAGDAADELEESTELGDAAEDDEDCQELESSTPLGEDESTSTAEEASATDNLDEKPEVTVPGEPAEELETEDIVEGDGAEAKEGDEVEVEYVGVAQSTETEFDSSWERDEPFSFGLGAGEVIPGWDEGIVGMKEGGRRLLVIPGDLAYGPTGQPPDIGPDETLVFAVDLVEVN